LPAKLNRTTLGLIGKMKKLLLLIIFAFLILAKSFAQVDTLVHKKGPFIWTNIGIDNSVPKLFAVKAELEFLAQRSILTIGYHDYSEFEIFGGSESRHDYYLLYGRYFSEKYLLLSLSGGLSSVTIGYPNISGSQGSGFYNNYEYHSVNYLGIVLKLQTIIYYKVIGIGFSVQANINNGKSYIGLGLNLSFGRLK